MAHIHNVEQPEKTVFLEGPAGQLEAKVTGILEEDSLRSQDIGIICHPHPLYQGTMDNKVVTTVTRAWRGLGLSTIRFNFRGVGQSEGQYGEGLGELEDLQAVLQWVQSMVPSAKVWLAGFSFGAVISAKVATECSTIQGLISIAPAVKFFDFLTESRPACPWVIVHGEQDEIVSLESVKTWYEQLKSLPLISEIKTSELSHTEITNKPKQVIELISLPDATHFFHGKLNEIKTIVEDFTTQNR
jgi:alpha/beta superfamily hydrolase